MPNPPATLIDEAGIALGNLGDAATGLITPTLRLGVTGLSRAGKTIFITSLVHGLLTGASMPGFSALSEGRLIGVRLGEHPDRGMPRFAYEKHLEALTAEMPVWPESTRRISQIRLTLKFESAHWLTSKLGPRQMHLDIVDYPGEWLLDLPLLTQSFAEWSAGALARVRRRETDAEGAAFLAALANIDPLATATETNAQHLAKSFTAYLRASRQDGRALSALPPGRFLLPGDMEGSPALTFAPVSLTGKTVPSDSLYAMLERRYEAYKDLIVRPFFRDHFARLDRQIVLVDALRALNAGPEAVADLEAALTEILACFRAGSPNPLVRLVARRIDKILFAATKADHLHSGAHDRLDAILNRLVGNATRRARFAGAETRSLAIAAVRATREDKIDADDERLDVIVGTPETGETLDGTVYDGETEIALYPGDLPADPDQVFPSGSGDNALKFMRFNPPVRLSRTQAGDPVLPNIRLDRAVNYLIGDWLA